MQLALSLNKGKGYGAFTLVLALLVVVAIFKVVMHFFIADKGIDLWDESVYVNLLNFSHLYPTEPHRYYGLIFNSFFPFEATVYNLRLLGWVNEILGVGIFSGCFAVWANHRYPSLFGQQAAPVFVVAFAMAGAAFSSVFTRAFSYNDFCFLATSVSVGTLLLLFRQPSSSGYLWHGVAYLFFALIGCLYGVLLIVKTPTAITTTIWVCAFLIVFVRQAWYHKLAWIGTMYAGLFLFATAYFGGIGGLQQWVGDISRGIEFLQQYLYSPAAIFLQGYLQVDLIENSKYYLVPLLVAAVAYWLLTRNMGLASHKAKVIVYFLGLVVWLILSLTVKQYFLGNFFNRFIAIHWYHMGFFVVPFAWQLAKQKQWQYVCLLLMFLGLPLVPLAGSNLPTTETFTKYISFWYAPVAFIWLNTFKQQLKWGAAIAIGIGGMGVANYIVVQCYNAYGLTEPVFAQTETVDGLTGMGPLKYDPQTARFLETTRDVVVASGYTKGGPILALGDICGVVLAMGGYQPETFWYFSDQNAVTPEQAREFDCYHLHNLKVAEHVRLPLVLIDAGTHQTVINCLAESEVPFPQEYYLAKAIYNPYVDGPMEIWAPHNWAVTATQP